MIVRRIGAATAVALVLAALALAGCAGAGRVSGSGPTATGVTEVTTSVAPTASLEATGPDSDPGDGTLAGANGAKGKDVTGADLAAIRAQLDAMQKELDALSMPTDSDFSGAEGAVY